MNVLVLYNSRSGHTRAAAEAISRAVREEKHFATVRSVAEVRGTDVAQCDLLFIGTWIRGFILFGVKPAGVELWAPSLPNLMNKPTGVFCTYRYNPRNSLDTLSLWVSDRGANVVAQHAFHRSMVEEGAGEFVRSVIDSATGQTAAYNLTPKF
ncbi:MAG: hypothetical protein IPK19_40495 [Chloroflexi bacterium]|nr:hypothetical protein [Chloroflexota bacterium]